MNPYAVRFSDQACRGAVVALADAVEARSTSGAPPLTNGESLALFYGALGFTAEQVAAGFAAVDATLRATPRGASTKTAAPGLAATFFCAARAVKP